MPSMGWLLLASATGLAGAVFGFVIAALIGVDLGGLILSMFAGFVGLPIVCSVVLTWSEKKEPPEDGPKW
jgi:nitrate/nitrite transporter NarK